MAIQIEEYKNTNTASKTYGQYYGRTVDNTPITLEELVDHMANHNTPYSPGCIKGVLTDMVKCIRHLLLDGINVKVGETPSFFDHILTMSTKSATTVVLLRNELRAATGSIRRTTALI